MKKVSITLSFIWGILLLPLSFFCYIAAGMAFENLRDPNIADYIFKYLLYAMPFVIAACIVISQFLRKFDKTILSILVQMFPIILCVFFVIYVYACDNPYIKTRIYLGDRITGTLVMTVDGKKYQPIEATIQYENDKLQKLNYDGDGNFKIKGGMYGFYHIVFKIENDKLYELTGDEIFLGNNSKTNFNILYFNTNWWHIKKVIINADLLKENNDWVMKCKTICTTSSEYSNVPLESIIEKTYNYDEVIQKEGIDIGIDL